MTVNIDIQEATMLYPQPAGIFKSFSRLGSAPQNYLAVDSVSMVIGEESKIAFMGHNGAGKSTLLKLIAGLLYPTLGRILINGIATTSRNSRPAQRISYVISEERSFYWRLTGEENLKFFASMNNLWGKALTNRVRDVTEELGIGGFSRKCVSDLSTGMRQRLALARGLIPRPDVLILDEPTKGLDPESAEGFRELILSKVNTGNPQTLLVATHDRIEAELLCGQICEMKEGKVVRMVHTSDSVLPRGLKGTG